MSQNTVCASTQACHDNGLFPCRWVRYGAEFVGTFFVVLVSIASMSWYEVVAQNTFMLPIALFMSYLAATFFVGSVSGGHLNPAVSLAAVITKRISWLDGIGYAVAQVLGGFAAAAVACSILPVGTRVTYKEWFTTVINGFGEDSPASQLLRNFSLTFSAWSAFFVEFLAVLLIAGVAMATLRKNGTARCSHALATATAYCVGFFITWPVTGAALNPARSTSVALAARILNVSKTAITQEWLFWCAALLAGLLVGLVGILMTSFHHRPVKADALLASEQLSDINELVENHAEEVLEEVSEETSADSADTQSDTKTDETSANQEEEIAKTE